jgi:putative ABC transport system substrate-binding protein
VRHFSHTARRNCYDLALQRRGPCGGTCNGAISSRFSAVRWCGRLPRARRKSRAQKVGFLYPGPVTASSARVAAFLDGLSSTGFRVAEQVDFVARISDGDPARLAPLAAELIEQKPDVIVTVGSQAARIVRSATTTIPIVAHDLGTDPVISGLIASLAHPGGNITGFFFGFSEFRMKWVEILKETIPNLTSVAVLWDSAAGSSQVKAVENAAGGLSVKMEILEAQRREDIAGAFVTATRLNVGAVLVLSSPVLLADLKMVADLAVKHKLPTVTFFGEFARAGGLMAYGPNLLDTYRQVGGMVGKVLRGVRPADLPAELPTKFELLLNLRTAKTLGLVIPQSVLLRADEVIE